MATIKTAISLEETLFAEVDSMARSLKISRSHLFVQAVTEYLHKLENQRLLDQINAAYADEESQQDDLQETMQQMQYHQRKMAEGEW